MQHAIYDIAKKYRFAIRHIKNRGILHQRNMRYAILQKIIACIGSSDRLTNYRDIFKSVGKVVEKF